MAAPQTRHAAAESSRLAPRHDPTPTLAFPEPTPAAADPWQFRLNRSSLIAAGLGVLLLMFIAFEIGRGTAGPSVASTATTDDTSSTALPNNTSRSQTRSTQVTAKTNRNNDSVALPEDHQASRTTEEEPLQPDTRGAIESVPHGRYLVVQDLAAQKNRSRRMDDGRRIVEHLESKGIAAKLIQPGRKAPHVIIAAPLDGMSDAAIENLKARVRRAGNDFPDYDFSSCYPASF